MDSPVGARVGEVALESSADPASLTTVSRRTALSLGSGSGPQSFPLFARRVAAAVRTG